MSKPILFYCSACGAWVTHCTHRPERDLVAVMLPRESVEHWTEAIAESQLMVEFKAACRKALKPMVPTRYQLDCMIAGIDSVDGADCKAVVAYCKYAMHVLGDKP